MGARARTGGNSCVRLQVVVASGFPIELLDDEE